MLWFIKLLPGRDTFYHCDSISSAKSQGNRTKPYFLRGLGHKAVIDVEGAQVLRYFVYVVTEVSRQDFELVPLTVVPLSRKVALSRPVGNAIGNRTKGVEP